MNNFTIQDDLEEITGERLSEVREILVVFRYRLANSIL
jgi:hypothetical protein